MRNFGPVWLYLPHGGQNLAPYILISIPAPAISNFLHMTRLEKLYPLSMPLREENSSESDAEVEPSSSAEARELLAEGTNEFSTKCLYMARELE